MKKVILILLFISSNAIAQQKLSVGLYHSIFDSVLSQGPLYSGQNANGTEQTNTAFGVSIDYTSLKKNTFGLGGGLSYDFERSFSGGTLSNTNYAYERKPGVNFLTFYANINYVFNNNLYTYFGPNLTSVFVKNIGGSQPEGKIGYQVGLGYVFDQQWSLELEYRGLNSNGIGTVSHAGTNIVDRIDSITLNSVLLKAKFSIGE